MKSIEERLTDLDMTITLSDRYIMHPIQITTKAHYRWYFIFGYLFRPRKIAEIGLTGGLEIVALTKGILETTSIDKLTFFGFDIQEDLEAEDNILRLGLESNFYNLTKLKEQPLIPFTLNSDLFILNFEEDTPFKNIKLLNLVWKNLKPGGWLIINNTNLSVKKAAINSFTNSRGLNPIKLDILNGIYLIKK